MARIPDLENDERYNVLNLGGILQWIDSKKEEAIKAQDDLRSFDEFINDVIRANGYRVNDPNCIIWCQFQARWTMKGLVKDSSWGDEAGELAPLAGTPMLVITHDDVRFHLSMYDERGWTVYFGDDWEELNE
jgi:hypothetical protein